MIGVGTRVKGVICEVGTCFFEATHIEDVVVIPGDPRHNGERHEIDVAVCGTHERQFQRGGLAGIVTAYGDQIAVVRLQNGTEVEVHSDRLECLREWRHE